MSFHLLKPLTLTFLLLFGCLQLRGQLGETGRPRLDVFLELSYFASGFVSLLKVGEGGEEGWREEGGEEGWREEGGGGEGGREEEEREKGGEGGGEGGGRRSDE